MISTSGNWSVLSYMFSVLAAIAPVWPFQFSPWRHLWSIYIELSPLWWKTIKKQRSKQMSKQKTSSCRRWWGPACQSLECRWCWDCFLSPPVVGRASGQGFKFLIDCLEGWAPTAEAGSWPASESIRLTLPTLGKTCPTEFFFLSAFFSFSFASPERG